MAEDGQLAAVRAFHDAFGRRDLEAIAGLLAPDVDWHAPNALPFGGPLRGVDAVRGYLTDLWGFFEAVDFGQAEMHAAGGAVMATGMQTVHTQNGDVHDLEYAQLFTVRDGLITGYRERSDAGEVVRVVTDEMTPYD